MATWNTVGHRMPPPRNRVLTFYRGYMCILQYELQEKGKWYDPVTKTNHKDVTHWISLPEAPFDTCTECGCSQFYRQWIVEVDNPTEWTCTNCGNARK